MDHCCTSSSTAENVLQQQEQLQPLLSYGQTSSTVWGPYFVNLNLQPKDHVGSNLNNKNNNNNNNKNNNNNQNMNNIDGLEVSIHTLPKPLQREFKHVFPETILQPIIDNIHIQRKQQQQSVGQSVVTAPVSSSTMESMDTSDNNDDCEFFAIPTNQHARMNLVAIGDEVEQEKDRLLNVFLLFAHTVYQQIQLQDGYWCDYIDPCSGLPMLSLHCNKVYSEVDGMECCLQYRSYNAGYCKILTHPTWGSAVYPATIFVYAPKQYLQTVFHQILLKTSITK